MKDKTVKTVCFLGAESTGKSTLVGHLSKIYETAKVDEYGRTLWMERNGELAFEDYLLIAQRHIELEEEARKKAHRFLFVDTSPLTTMFYAQAFCGKVDPALEALSHRKYDYTFLCHPDFPLVQDGWRGDDDFRIAQHQWYVDILRDRKISAFQLRGAIENRINRVTEFLLGDAL